MFTNKAIEHFKAWAAAAKAGETQDAAAHLREFYHVGASLLASAEFREEFRRQTGHAIESEHLQHFCQFLELMAAIEGRQVRQFGRAA